MKKILLWAAALPLLLALAFAAGCSEPPPRTPKQTQDEARQAAEAAQQKALTADAERRQNAAADRAPDAAVGSPDAPVHLPPDIPGQDEDIVK